MTRRLAAAMMIGIACIAAAAVPGCIVVLADGSYAPARFRESRTLHVAHVAGKPLEVTTGNGEVVIRRAGGTGGGAAGGAGDVTIEAHLRASSEARLQSARVEATRRDDGTLTIADTWPESRRRGSERCDFVITVPDASLVRVTTSNGEINLTGLAGPAELQTSNGAICVTDHDGPVKARTSNGEITLKDVRSADAQSSNGEIAIRLLPDAAGPVIAETSNGEISVAVGPGFVGPLTASTSNGGIADHTGRGAVVTRSGRHRATFVFGDPAAPAAATAAATAATPASSVTSSNGEITLRSR